LTVRTGTTVDTGRWFRRSPLWLCLMPERLVLLAVGRRHYAESFPLADCSTSHYHAASGCLVIAPAEGLRFPHLRIPASEAIRILQLIHSTPKTTERC
jgi:hypothetical protein